MPLGQSQDISQADPEGRVTPRFWHRLIRFRHFIGGSLALASLNLACRDQVPTFPQRSPPSLLTTAARGGLSPAPDCRPRRALLHLSYSSARYCQLKRPWYARRVGGAAARVGELLCSPIALPRSAERGRRKALWVR